MKNVIFDFGNVIIRWRPYMALSGLYASEEDMMQHLKQIGFFDWNAEQDRGRSWQEGLAVIKAEQPDNAHIFKAYMDGLEAAHSELVPGTSALIEKLDQNGVGLYGLTNAATESFQAVQNVAPVIACMRDVVVSGHEKMIKPSAEIFNLCLDRNGLDAAQTLFVDDSKVNCTGAAAVGLATHHFTTADLLEQDLKRLNLL